MAVSPGGALFADADATVEPAPAKINLALHVTGRRSDGLHILDTLVVFADEGDIIRARGNPDGAIVTEFEGPFAETLTTTMTTEENLVLKAAQAIAAKRLGHRNGVRLVVNKRLPVAAGIGGGSADAAATLRLLHRLWVGGKDNGLVSIAARLGADVPMCLLSQPLRALGTGEKIIPVAGMPAIPMVLVNPGVAVATKKVFERLGPADNPHLPDVKGGFRSVFELVIWLRQTRNGLDEAARADAKVIGRVLSALESDPDCLLARMSGSGPTCFGIFASRASAQRAAVRLRVGRPDWWIAACVTGAS